MYRRIVVASDLEAPAAAGARLAATLAAPDAAFLAVHVGPSMDPQLLAAPAVGLDPIPGLGWGQVARTMPGGTEGENELRGRLDGWVRETGVPNMDAVVRRGDVARTVLKEADDFAADLVVLGARGHTRLEEALMGSATKDVLRHSKVDVLLAEEERAHHVPPRRIAVAVNFDDASVLLASRARVLADHLGADLALLHAIGPGTQTGASYGLLPDHAPLGEETERLRALIEEKLHEFNRAQFDGRARVHLSRGPFASELSRLAHEADADLLLTAHHPTRFLERLLLGSVSEAVARHPPCSTLFVHV